MEKIRICYVITGLNTGGAEMMLYKTLKHIDRDKFEPVVVSLLPKGAVSEYICAENIEVYSLNFSGIRSLIQSIIRFWKIIRIHNPVILHAYMFHADMLSRFVGKALNVPIIISSVRNENVGGKYREVLMKYTDKLTDFVTVVCQKACLKLIENKTIKKEKSMVIYNGVELYKFNRKLNDKQESTNFEILSIGRLHEQKNFPLLINAIAEIVHRYPNIHVSIVGEGEKRDQIIQLIDEKKLNNTISLLGRREDVNYLLNKCDLFVLPSSWEGMPNVVLEAMASSKPVIATNVGGTPEIIKDENMGILIPPNNLKAMIDSIVKVINMSTDEREKMGKEARRRIENQFDIKKTVKDTENLYFSLINKKNCIDTINNTFE